MKKYDIIISINVHENVEFLIRQLNNIKENVKCSYCVILNCNDYMYSLLKNLNLENIFINDKIINKRRYHGSLLNGIYSNMEYSLKNFDFEYFFILSSRNVFFQNIDTSKINNSFSNGSPNKIIYLDNNGNNNGYWHHFDYLKNSKLGNYYLDNNLKLYHSAHEGMLIKKIGCDVVYSFLSKNNDIKDNLFNLEGVSEEFGFQTILMNEINNEIPFVSLNYGNICASHTDPPTEENSPFYLIKTIRI